MEGQQVWFAQRNTNLDIEPKSQELKEESCAKMLIGADSHRAIPRFAGQPHFYSYF